MEQLKAFHARANPVPLFNGWFIGMRLSLIKQCAYFTVFVRLSQNASSTNCIESYCESSNCSLISLKATL